MKLTDGKTTVEITMKMWDGNSYGPDWSHDFFEAGNLEKDEETGAYIVEDVEYCVSVVEDWQNYCWEGDDEETMARDEAAGLERAAFFDYEDSMKQYVDSYKVYENGSYQSSADGQGFEAENDAQAWEMVIANEKEVLGWDYTVDSVEIVRGMASIQYHDEDGTEYEEEISLYYRDADGELIRVEAE